MKKKNYLKSFALLSGLLLFEQSIVLADTAISVPRNARAAIENAKNDFRSIEDRIAREKAEASYKQDATDYVDRAKAPVVQIKNDLASTKARIERAQLELERTKAAREEAQKALNEAKAHQEEQQQNMQSLYEEAAQASQYATEIMRSSWAREAEIQRLVDQATLSGTELPGQPEQYIVDWAKVVQAQIRADQLLAEARQLEAKARAADGTVVEINDKLIVTESQAASAEQELKFAREAETAYSDALLKAENNLDRALSMQEKLLYKLAHPAPYTYSAAYSGLRYYSWKDGGGSGYQLVQPLNYTYGQDKYSINLSTYYLWAHNSSATREGSVHTSADTNVNLSKRVERKKYSIDYLFDIIVPTGKASLNASGRNARMPDDLVEVDQYGKGWQVNPGVQVSWPNGANKWTVGTGYLLSRSYDQTSDIPNDTVFPGYEWRKYLRYQHAKRSRQLVAEIINTSYGTTTFQNNNSYHLNDGWNYRLTYNKELGNNQELLFYYWLENAGRNDQAPQNSNNAYAHYYGTMWSKKVDAKSTIRVSFDALYTDGNRYDGIQSYWDSGGEPQYNYIEVAGRTKYTFGLGYDRKINGTSCWSFDLQHFYMKDGASNIDSPKKYHGCNVSIIYNKTL